jgi:hypothetical protein
MGKWSLISSRNRICYLYHYVQKGNHPPPQMEREMNVQLLQRASVRQWEKLSVQHYEDWMPEDNRVLRQIPPSCHKSRRVPLELNWKWAKYCCHNFLLISSTSITYVQALWSVDHAFTISIFCTCNWAWKSWVGRLYQISGSKPKMSMLDFWVVTPCRLIGRYQHTHRARVWSSGGVLWTW